MLTFLLFSRNDHPDEQLRVQMSLTSLIEQDTKKPYRILFTDLSEQGKELIVPQTDKLKVIYLPTPVGPDWFPTYYRNKMMLEAETPFVCHTNCDCIYAQNFAEVIMGHLEENPKRLVMCQRTNLPRENMGKIKSTQDGRTYLKYFNFKSGKNGCGDCQAISRLDFIKVGGFFKLIKDGQAIKGDWKTNAYAEDLYLKNNAKKLGFEEYWVSDKTDILHLAHPVRENTKIYLRKFEPCNPRIQN